MSRSARKALTGALAVAALAAAASALPDADETPAPRRAATKTVAAAAPHCRFDLGETAAFTLESTTRDVRGEEEDHLRGTLSWEVVDQLANDRWRLRAALRDVSLTQALTLPEERTEGALTDPFFVDVDASCRFVGFGFAPEWDARRRQLVQSTLVTHEYVVSAAPRRTLWSASQLDGLGAFEARYELAPAKAGVTRVQRHKAAYEGGADAASFGIAVAVVGSEATASFDPERPHWLTASAGLERVQLRVQGAIAADLIQRFRLTRDDDRFAPVPAMDPRDADFRDAYDLEIVRDVAEDAEVAALSFDEALAAFAGRFQGQGDPSYAAARDLAAWLKGHPEGAAELAAALRGGQIEDVARPALFLALELSGTQGAREVLADALVDADLRAIDRARAASALSDIGEPTRETAELLLARTQADPDPMVANVSVLGVGHLAKRSDDDELRSYVREALGEALAAASDEGSTRVLLDAIGNTGDPAFADELTAHLGAESPTTRQHAAEALGRLDPSESGPRLLDRLSAEDDPTVSASIIRSYRGPASADAIARMSDKLATSTSASERSALITWLGAASRTEPAAQRQLIAHLDRETDARLMQQIGAFIPAAALR